MNFSTALDALKSGKCAKRKGWEGFLTFKVRTDGSFSLIYRISESYPWGTLSITDIFADDWVIVDPVALPCPLCGEDEVSKLNSNWVRCDRCKAEGPLDLWNEAKR